MSAAALDEALLKTASVRDVIDHWARECPDAIFLIDPDNDVSLTFADLKKSAEALSIRLEEEGCHAGDSVGYAMVNGIDTAKTILGIMYGGYVATAINLVSGRSTISYVLSHSSVRTVFCQPATQPLLHAAMAANSDAGHAPNLIEVDDALFALDNDDQSTFPVNAGDDTLLMYTSGTTGVPKGVVHTHTSLLAGGHNTVIAHKLDAGDRALCVLPLYHINGLCVTLIGALVSGGSVVIPEKFSVSRFWDILRDNKCTWFSVVPTQISYLLHEAETLAHDVSGLEGLRFGRSASAPLSPDVQEAFEKRFSIPVIETMGLTETAAQILSNPIDGTRKIGSPGIAYGNEVIIGDENQNALPPESEGEVLVRGANVMRLYRDNPNATSESITSKGWLRTGDLGRMDSDGYIYITGRLKELIIKGGENIAPREVDEALYSHPDVIEAAAFPRDCQQYGQRVEAGVKLRQGSNLTSDALVGLCQEKIGAFKAPDHVHILPELPKGPSGKIQRLKLIELTS